jgi:hypothetical protein
LFWYRDAAFVRLFAAPGAVALAIGGFF